MGITSSFMADLVFFLEHDATLGLTYGVNLFKGPKARLPDVTTAIVTIYRTGGLGEEGTHNAVDAPAYERPTAQIVARATDYDVAEAMILKLHASLWPVQNQFINGTWWRQINVRSEPFDLPLDEKGRARQAFNIDCVKRLSPAQS